MDTIFTVTAEHLAALTSEEAVSIFRELLWAEASTVGIGKSLINVPSAITVSDGGIDAEVEYAPTNSGQGIIKQGLTCYQIKTGDYSLRKQGNVRKLLCTPSSKGTILEPRVKDCIDKGGTYIVVLFGWDKPETKPGEFVAFLRGALKEFDPRYEQAKVEVWRPNQVVGFLKPFPSLALKVNHRGDAQFQTHQSWLKNTDMQGLFESSAIHNTSILELQATLRRNDQPVHCHIIGEPGIGKTRYVLEATKAIDLTPLVIYCGDANRFRDSILMNELLRENFSAILVLDECDLDDRGYIWNRLERCSPRVKVISIYNDAISVGSNTLLIDVPSLGKSQISNIIQSYRIPKDQADHWSYLCDCSPRVAHIIGLNLKSNPDDPLRSMGNIWERYITNDDKANSDEVRKRTLVLRYLALFQRFGYGRPVSIEADTILKMIQRVSLDIDQAVFEEIIDKLKVQRILQGRHTLYITPKALHIKLWIDWWRVYGRSFRYAEFLEDLSSTPPLLQWFFEMFRYAAQSEAATEIVSELLGENGPFQTDDFLQTKAGARFFLVLTEAYPAAALVCLKRTIGTWHKEKLFVFTNGRREVVWALERIAMWRELFVDAARLLLALGEAENETWANNASVTFTGLFSLGAGELATTQASPQERLLVLKEGLESFSKERRLLTIHACNKALESRNFFRDVGAEYQGLRKVPDMWMPQTYGELFEAYRQVWLLLFTRLDDAPVDEQPMLTTILLQRAQELSRYVALADVMIDAVSELMQKPFVDKKKMLADIIRLLRHNGKQFPEHIRQRWEQVKNVLLGNDFSSRMKRYVGMDILEDAFDERGNRVDQTQHYIEELAQEVLEKPQLLALELHWLVTAEAQNGYRFGYELGQCDVRFSLLSTLLEAQHCATENASVFFLGGYLRVLFEKDQAQWEEQADLLAQDEQLRMWLPELTWRSGLTARAALRLLKLAEENAINIGSFRFFSVGRNLQTLPEDVFQRWLDVLLKNTHPHALSIALDMYHGYYIETESVHVLPKDLSLMLLTYQPFLESERSIRFDSMDHYAWTEIGRSFVLTYPESSIILADWMIEHFGEDGTIFDNFSGGTLSVLNLIAERYPQEVWLLIGKRLGSRREDTRAYHIAMWLRGESDSASVHGSGALNLFPVETIWQWVAEDKERRAPYLASFVPKTLFKQDGRICLAKEVLQQYGAQEEVRHAFSANYFSGSSWGPESMHYEIVKRQLLDFKAIEEDKNVHCWIDEYITGLNQGILRAKILEERDVY